MTQGNLAQANGYSGAAHEGLNAYASYHRMVYENRKHIHSIDSFMSTIQELTQKFQSSDRSRLVARVLLEANPGEIQKAEIFASSLGGTIGYYPDQTPDNPSPFWYVTFSYNRSDRNPSCGVLKELADINSQYIKQTSEKIGDFTNHSQKQLEQFSGKGFLLTENIQSDELSELWTPFGWSDKACEGILNSNSEDFVLGVRNKNRRLVAAILYSHQPHELENGTIIKHGEMTEATTLEEYRGNGVMGVLATALNVKARMNGIYNIYGEYRILSNGTKNSIQSLKFAIESGVTFTQTRQLNYLFNHVDIEGAPDIHNQGLMVPGYNGNAHELRSFLIGSANQQSISEKVQQNYMNALFF